MREHLVLHDARVARVVDCFDGHRGHLGEQHAPQRVGDGRLDADHFKLNLVGALGEHVEREGVAPLRQVVVRGRGLGGGARVHGLHAVEAAAEGRFFERHGEMNGGGGGAAAGGGGCGGGRKKRGGA